MRNGIDHCAQSDDDSSRYLADYGFNIHVGGTLKLQLEIKLDTTDQDGCGGLDLLKLRRTGIGLAPTALLSKLMR